MANNQVIMVADKQSFLVRVLMQKVQAAEAECVYVPFRVNDISSKLQELSLVILYMEEDDGPHDDVLHYLIDADITAFVLAECKSETDDLSLVFALFGDIFICREIF